MFELRPRRGPGLDWNLDQSSIVIYEKIFNLFYTFEIYLMKKFNKTQLLITIVLVLKPFTTRQTK